MTDESSANVKTANAPNSPLARLKSAVASLGHFARMNLYAHAEAEAKARREKPDASKMGEAADAIQAAEQVVGSLFVNLQRIADALEIEPVDLTATPGHALGAVFDVFDAPPPAIVTHDKTGKRYTLLGVGWGQFNFPSCFTPKDEASKAIADAIAANIEMKPFAIYLAETGSFWVRPAAQFLDRFTFSDDAARVRFVKALQGHAEGPAAT